MRANTEPIEEYRHRLDARRHALTERTSWNGTVANARLAVFVVGAALVWLACVKHWVNPGWLAIPVLAFIVLVIVHDRIVQSMRRLASGIEYYERGIARLEDRWMGTGWDGADLVPANHPYANDLDIFGPGSLFQLLCTAQTRAGGKTLAEWLCAPAVPDEIRARQGAVEALRPLIDLREELAYQGRGLRAGVSPEIIAAWASAAPVFQTRRLTIIAYVVSLAAILSGAGLWLGAPPLVFLWAVVILFLFHAAISDRIRRATSAAEEPWRELEIVGRVLARLEREPFNDPYLRAIQDIFKEGPPPASAAIARLGRLLRWREAGLNLMFGPVAAVLLWGYHFTRAIEAWRARYGVSVGRWLDAVGRLEALCALASHACEHPADPFPMIETTGPVFKGEGLGHPFLPAGKCVRNDIVLDMQRRMLIVSGSNMSGKTVLLRTAGVNAVLASAGAPVRARVLTFSPLSIGATVNVHDAILAGESRFYAEIKRIRALMDIARGPVPLLFLLDEIFHGTNSWDRRIGARAVLRAFLDAGAIGIVTTHDLAITELAGDFEGAANAHFQDHLENGRLVFDYQLRPGVVTKSNALELMRAIGLDVE